MSYDTLSRTLAALPPVLCIAVTGCASWIAGQIARAPGPGNTNYVVSAESRERFAVDYGFGQIAIETGPPRASLTVTIIQPRDYGLEYDFQGYDDDTIDLEFRLKDPATLPPARRVPSGTVIVLPGMLQSRYTMTFWGIGLAQRGYRVVLVDLRGHGDSTGRHLTYGVVEARDTLQVVETLESLGIAERPLALMGASYGAVTALMAAAKTDDISAVVAFAPFTDAPSSIEHLARTLFPYLFWAVSDETMAEAIDRASTLAGVDLRTARAIESVARIEAPVLFVHGREDTWVPPANSLALYRAANGSASLMVIPGAGHMDLPMRYEAFSDRVFDWLDRALARSHRSPSVTAASETDVE